MNATTLRALTSPVRRAALPLLALFFLIAAPFGSAGAQQRDRERVDGVTNFGRVTDKYFRGGEVTAAGVERLYEMGVRTIVNLRDEASPDLAAPGARRLQR